MFAYDDELVERVCVAGVVRSVCAVMFDEVNDWCVWCEVVLLILK